MLCDPRFTLRVKQTVHDLVQPKCCQQRFAHERQRCYSLSSWWASTSVFMWEPVFSRVSTFATKKKKTLKSSFAAVQKCDGEKHFENLKRPLSIGRWPSHWEFQIVRIVKFQCESNPVAIAIKKKFKISNIHSQLNITHGRTRRRFELSNDRV